MRCNEQNTIPDSVLEGIEFWAGTFLKSTSLRAGSVASCAKEGRKNGKQGRADYLRQVETMHETFSGNIEAGKQGKRNRRPGSGAVAWHLSVMSTITIPLPDDDLSFLRAYSEAQGTSAEAFLARQARNLREHLQRPLQPDVVAATGIIPPEIAGREKHRGHLEKKHA